MKDQTNLKKATVTFIIAFGVFYAFGWMLAETQEVFTDFSAELPKPTNFLITLSADITPRIVVSTIIAGVVALITYILLKLDKIVFVISFLVLLVILLLGLYYISMYLPIVELGEAFV